MHRNMIAIVGIQRSSDQSMLAGDGQWTAFSVVCQKGGLTKA